MTLINLTIGDVTMTVSEECRNGHKRTESNSSAYKSNGRDRIMCTICRRTQLRKADKARAGRKRQRSIPRGGPALIRWAEKRIAAGENEQAVMLDAAKRMACSRMGVALSRFDAYNKEHDEAREQAYNEILEARFGLTKDDSKKPWSYLRGKPEAQAAWERFDAALTEARASGEGVPRCENDPAPYTDFGGEGFDHGDDLPTSEEAYMLCAECPLLELCGNWAELERPAWGVWAGTLWIGGEEVHD